jgi:transposase-like protein
MAPLTTRTVVCSRCEEELVLGYAPSSRVAYVCSDCEERAVVRAQSRRRALLSVVIAVAFLLALASAALLGLRTEGPPTRDPVTPGR